mmetsp:Transcript_39172/g.91816  ORF Transcript_39172/g.91816 Transcript_39172/m.91816 type:complete len:211 (+) Transcript_39172:2841-3473(+)
MTDLKAFSLNLSKSIFMEAVDEAERVGAAVTEPATVAPRNAEPLDERLELKLELIGPAGAPVPCTAFTLFRALRFGKIQLSWQARADIAAAAVRTAVLLELGGSWPSKSAGVLRLVFKLGFGVARATGPMTNPFATGSTVEVAKAARPMRRMRRLRSPFELPAPIGFEKHAMLPSFSQKPAWSSYSDLSQNGYGLPLGSGTPRPPGRWHV